MPDREVNLHLPVEAVVDARDRHGCDSEGRHHRRDEVGPPLRLLYRSSLCHRHPHLDRPLRGIIILLRFRAHLLEHEADGGARAPVERRSPEVGRAEEEQEAIGGPWKEGRAAGEAVGE